MEPFVAGLVLVAALTALDAALTWAVLRPRGGRRRPPRSWDHEAAEVLDLGIAVGDRMPAFTGATGEGLTVTRGDLAGREALVAFLSLDCSGCEADLPAFRERARALRAAGGRVLATVVGIGAAGSELAREVAGIADFVVPEYLDAPVSNRFGARFYPGFAHYGPDGVVTAAGIGVEGLGETAQPSLP